MFRRRSAPKIQVGDIISEWLDIPIPKNCCNIFKTMNAWGPQSCRAHSKTLAKIMILELNFKVSDYHKLKLLIYLASAHVNKKNQ